MKLDLEKTRQVVERALHSAQQGERGGVRVHCRAAEKLLKGVKTPPGPEVLQKVHHASTAIETSLAVKDLEQALDLLGAGTQT